MAVRDVTQLMEPCPEHEDCTLLVTSFVNERGPQMRRDHLEGPEPERLLNESYPEAYDVERGIVRRPRRVALDELGRPVPRRRWWRRG